MPEVDSASRRVLCNKSTNASLPARNPNSKTKSTGETLDLRPPLSPRTRSSGDQEFSLTSPRIGQKRRIEEVDRSTANDSQNTDMPQQLSQPSQLFSDGESEEAEHSLSFETGTKSTTDTALTSFHASQEGPAPVELHFEIQEEMSQRTLDKMHAVALPQNTSQLIPPLRPNLEKENSQLSVSMSSLIDFDHSDSSQAGEGSQLIEMEKSAEYAATSTEEARRILLSKKAETLRTRLQLAIYKVQTNQMSKPFSRLLIPKHLSPSPDPPASSTPRAASVCKEARYLSDVIESPESRIATARARATMQPKPNVRPLTSLAMPTIVPTAFSVRWNEHDAALPQHVPSSPPPSQGSDSRIQDLQRNLTPSPPLDRVIPAGKSLPYTPIQLSSPPGSIDRIGDGFGTGGRNFSAMKAKDWNRRPGGLTSSVIKGEAATGLLELMRGSEAGVSSKNSIGMCGL